MEKKTLNLHIFSAGLFMALTFFVHVFIGGPEIYTPLRSSDLLIPEISTLSVVWHFTSMQLFIVAGALIYLAKHPNWPLFLATLVTVSGFTALFIGYGLFDFGSIWPMPQWIAFAVTALLMVRGMQKQ